MHKLTWVLAALLLTACQPKVDNSNTESLVDSLNEMVTALSADQRQQLRDALVVIALSETGYLGEPPLDAVAVAQDSTLGPALTRALDGESFEDLLTRAAALREVKEQRTIEAGEKAKREVLARIQQAKAEMEHVKSITAQKAVYGWTRGDYMPQAVVEFELVNNSGQTINGVRLRGDLFTPERDQPWAHEVLTHELIRALPDQQAAEFRLVPNQYSSWGNRSLQKRRDTRLQLTVINVKVGDSWLVSADLEQLDKELKAYDDAITTAQKNLNDIRIARTK
jgi:hypothetical protein